jgi:quercetin dioxygenase-like cupin family protein
MSYRLLRAAQAYWRPSNQMRVQNTNLAGQLGSASLGARLWRLEPGQASTLHRHRREEEIYVLLDGVGRMRIDGEPITLAPLDAVLVDPDSVRQIFNDTESEQLWLVVGAPPEPGNTLEMSQEELHFRYPEGPQALPPELA